MRIWLPIVVIFALAMLGSAMRESREKTTGQQHLAQVADGPRIAGTVDSRASVAEPSIGPLDLPSPASSIATEQSDEFAHGTRAAFHPHGEQICASGCAASHHPTELLTRNRFQRLLAEYSVEPCDEPGEAFETLLFFGRQVAAWLNRDGTGPLDPRRADLLKVELARGHAEVSLRLVDESGVVRASLPATRVPLDRRHEFTLDPHNLQPLIASGTVKRVGRDHLWTRL